MATKQLPIQASNQLKPQRSLYQSLLQAGTRIKPLQQVHAHIIISGSHNSLPFLTKLLTFSVAAGSILYTRQLLDSVHTPDSFLFSSLIKASSKHHFPLHSILFYQEMLLASSTTYTSHAFTAVIKACAELPSLKLGRAVHCHVLVCGFGSDQFVQAALVSFYAKCVDLGVAREVFDQMVERTVVAWNSMISGCEQNGFAEEAVGLFYEMHDLGVEFYSTHL